MDWPRLDTSSWNLSLGAAATSMLAACGPFIILEGQTDTDTATDTDPPPSDTSETETSPPLGECRSTSDCEPGYECIDNVCMPYDYCDTAGCCYDGGCCYDDCCYGECYYECYDDAQCGYQGLCEDDYGYNACIYPEQLPECDGVPAVVPLELPEIVEGEVIMLSFVELNGDGARDLVVSRTGGAELHWGANAAPPMLLPVQPEFPLFDVASGDFDADGDADLVLATDVTLDVRFGDGAGGFSLSQQIIVGEPFIEIAAVSFNGDEMLDLAMLSVGGEGMLLFNDGDGILFDSAMLPTNGFANSLVKSDFGGDPYDDLAIQDDGSGAIILGDFSGDTDPDYYLPGSPHGQRRLLSGPMDQEFPWEIVGYSPQPSGWMLVELWAYGLEGPQRYSLLGDDFLADMGDFDGNGVNDVITLGSAAISYVPGDTSDGYPRFTCRSTYFTGFTANAMAVGDFDGNQRADVALERDGSLVLMLTF